MSVSVLTVPASACAPNPPTAAVGIVADTCGADDGTGSGAIVGPGLVLTSAHVVAGATSVTVTQADRTAPATIVAFDPEMDLAYLSVEGLTATSFEVANDHVDDGDHAVAYVVRDHTVVAVPARIRRRVQLSTEDIYVEGETLRPGFELEADIEPGDSGGAVLVDGKLVGVVWARSRRADDRAYAIDPIRGGALVERQLRSGTLGPDVDVTRCR